MVAEPPLLSNETIHSWYWSSFSKSVNMKGILRICHQPETSVNAGSITSVSSQRNGELSHIIIIDSETLSDRSIPFNLGVRFSAHAVFISDTSFPRLSCNLAVRTSLLISVISKEVRYCAHDYSWNAIVNINNKIIRFILLIDYSILI